MPEDIKTERSHGTGYPNRRRDCCQRPRAGVIEECYGRLAKLPVVVARYGHATSPKKSAALVANIPLVAEAPTGTGKTMAYSISALTAAEVLHVTVEWLAWWQLPLGHWTEAYTRTLATRLAASAHKRTDSFHGTWRFIKILSALVPA